MTTSATSADHQHLASFLQEIADESCKKRLAGVAIGVIVDGQELTACSGFADTEANVPVSDSTVFEVGSISKLFTSLLLAIAATRREVALDDPVQAALGETVMLPTDGESQITYRSLTNHRSSLPRLPDDLLATADMKNPYVHYDEEMLYACLNRMKSLRPIGSLGEYSNFGVGLLGHALGKVAGSNYRIALKERVLVPLGMQDTSTESCQPQENRLAVAHKKKNKPTSHWDFTEATVGAGGVRSSLADMFKFLRANIDPAASPLADELALMRQPSDLPRYDGEPIKPPGSSIPMVLFVVVFLTLVGFTILLFGLQWVSRIGPDSFLSFSILMIPTFVVAGRWNVAAGAVTLAVMTCLTWGLWGVSADCVPTLIMGTSLLYACYIWKSSWSAYLEQQQGNGRLAWQSSYVGEHPMLWHNGMVGGSASFLGIVEEFKFGVVVLTNTAKVVDDMGVRILSELVRLKKEEQREQNGLPTEDKRVM